MNRKLDNKVPETKIMIINSMYIIIVMGMNSNPRITKYCTLSDSFRPFPIFVESPINKPQR